MSRLQSARDRLEEAVTRLEAAAESGRADTAGHAGLAAALDAARQENTALQATNEAVGSQLDRIIDRLRSMLDD